jgi:signal transduction histidine kinase/CheY-like chemotaxis protein
VSANPPSRHRLAWLPALALALAWLASTTPLLQRLSVMLDDSAMRLVARNEPIDDTLVVDIDDASLLALKPLLGDWPYRRDAYVPLIDFLREAGATLTVFNIVLADSRPGDEVLAQAISRQPDVVLAAAGLKQSFEGHLPIGASVARLSDAVDARLEPVRWPAMAPPAAALLAALHSPGALAVVTTPLDEDGHLRRLPLLHAVDGRILPSLPVAAHMLGGGCGGSAPSYEGGALRCGPHRWAIDGRATAALALPANRDAVPTVAFATLMNTVLGKADDRPLRALVEGRAVFIGSSALIAEEVSTPLGRMNGTLLLANAFGALGRDAVLAPAGWPLQTALLAIALVPSGLAWRRGRAALRPDIVAALCACAAIVGVSMLGLFAFMQQPAPLLALFTVLVGIMLAAIVHLRALSAAHRQMAFERTVADAANQAKTEFLASVSHELRTPLNALVGMAEALSKTALDDEQRRYVNVFRSAGASLVDLVNDLLDLSKVEAGKLELEVSDFLLRPLFEEQLALLRPRAAAKHLRLALQMADGTDVVIRGDRKRLSQAIVNLLGNAIKFTREGGVTAAVHRQGEAVFRFDFTDTGIGVAPGKFDLIFEPFVQADGSVARAFGGTGLGLSITKSLVELMGGRIWVSSTPGQGSTFSFTIQATVVEAPAAAFPHAPALRTDARDIGRLVAAPGMAHSILVVDDNEVNQLVVEALLRRSGLKIDLADSGPAAIERFRSGRYGLIFMDVQMPGMDGHAATREIRHIEAAEGRPRTPVIALTANAFESDRVRSLEAGCDGHLAKPLSGDSLFDALTAHGLLVQPAVEPCPAD